MTTTTEFYQPSTVPNANIFTSSQENPFPAMKITSNDHHTNNFNNPFTAHPATSAISTLTILTDQLKSEDFMDPLSQIANGSGNGYQKLPYRSPVQHSILDNDAVDHHLTSKLNRMYTQSPQMPRKAYEFSSNTMNTMQGSPQLHHVGSHSPYMQRKFPPNENEYGNPYNPYKPLPPPSTFSPVIRKRYQEGHLVSEDLEFRILHGNTSPIVLQRFYHQQNQLKDQKEEDQLRAIRMQSSSPNPFKTTQSCIPVKSSSPLPTTRLQHQQHHAQMLQRNILHQQHNNEPTYNASQKLYESHIPQLQSRMVANGNGSIPYRLHQPQPQHHQPMYDNLAHRAQIPCPSSPQLDRLRANLEKPNFYERHQKLPVEIESSYQLESNMNQLQHNGAFISDKNKDKGMSRFMLNVETKNLNPRLKIQALTRRLIIPSFSILFY